MQYVSRKPLIEELKNIAKFNKTESVISTIKKQKKLDTVDILKDKASIKAFLTDLQYIINETNYNTKTAVLKDLKDILVSLKILSTDNKNIKIDNITETLAKSIESINKILKENNINKNNINDIIEKIINKPLDKKYISDIFKTINTSNISANKKTDIKTIVNNLSDYNTYIEKEINVEKKQSSINVLTAIKTKFTQFNKGALRTFTKSFILIGSSIKALGFKTLSFINKTVSFTYNLAKTIATTSLRLISNIISGTFSITKSFFSSLGSFLLSPSGLLILSFIGGFIWGKFSKQIIGIYTKIKILIVDFVDKFNDIANNIDSIITGETSSGNEYIDKVIGVGNDIYKSLIKIVDFVNNNYKTIIDVIGLITTITTIMPLVANCAGPVVKAIRVVDLLRRGLTQSLAGGLSGALALSGSFIALQTIHQQEKEENDHARTLLNIDRYTIDAVTVSNRLLEYARKTKSDKYSFSDYANTIDLLHEQLTNTDVIQDANDSIKKIDPTKFKDFDFTKHSDFKEEYNKLSAATSTENVAIAANELKVKFEKSGILQQEELESWAPYILVSNIVNKTNDYRSLSSNNNNVTRSSAPAAVSNATDMTAPITEFSPSATSITQAQPISTQITHSTTGTSSIANSTVPSIGQGLSTISVPPAPSSSTSSQQIKHNQPTTTSVYNKPSATTAIPHTISKKPQSYNFIGNPLDGNSTLDSLLNGLDTNDKETTSPEQTIPNYTKPAGEAIDTHSVISDLKNMFKNGLDAVSVVSTQLLLGESIYNKNSSDNQQKSSNQTHKEKPVIQQQAPLTVPAPVEMTRSVESLSEAKQ